MIESIVNAQTVTKVVRSRSFSRRCAGEKLYAIKSFSFDGTLIDTKGAIAREAQDEILYVFISAKVATNEC
ncbi:MAG: hypothetical protein HYR85_27115 [Planctomycetes bacterium]|nr:hypothetical protein [Planctomycetota bacterium]MBI3847265.1 hypothetical protein [Planctomycetota bacterium]